MKLYGEVVSKDVTHYTNPITQIATEYHKIYLKSHDPLAGALEVSVDAETAEKIKAGDKVSFSPTFGTRIYNRATIVTVTRVSDLEVA